MFCIWCGAPAAGEVVIRCDGCGRTHYLHSKVSGSALVVDGDRYLTTLRAAPPQQGRWDLPGGFCEYGEDPATTAVRETLEETGIKVTASRLLGVFMDQYVEPDGRPWPTVNHVYLATPSTTVGNLSAVDPGEVAALEWHRLAAPPANAAFPAQQLGAIDAYLS